MTMTVLFALSAAALAAATQSSAQEVTPAREVTPAPGVMAAAPITPPPAEIVTFGTDATTRMTVPVSIGTAGPFAFVVDTGSERTVISRELADRLALSAGGSAMVHSMTGSARVDTVLIPSLRVSANPTTDIRAPAFAQQNIGASGLIGIDSLRNQRVTLDFKAGTMTITPGQKSSPARTDRDEIVVTARRRAGQLILMGATINDNAVDVIIDTGAQVSVGNMALQRRLMGRNPRVPPKSIELISVTGARADASYTTVREIKLGGATIQNMPIAFSEAPIFKTLRLTDRPAMLLGMDALRMFDRVSVDFASRKVRLLMPGGAGRDSGTRLADREPERPPAI
jgi:predicted aspartyl protease